MLQIKTSSRISDDHKHTHARAHIHTNEGCRTTLIGNMYNKTQLRKKKARKKIEKKCIDNECFKIKVNIKRQMSLSETDSVADLLAVDIAMIAEGIHIEVAANKT